MTDDALQFGYAVLLVIAADLLSKIVAVAEAFKLMVTPPAVALQNGIVNGATAVSTGIGLGPFLPWVATLAVISGLYLLSRWRWSEA